MSHRRPSSWGPEPIVDDTEPGAGDDRGPALSVSVSRNRGTVVVSLSGVLGPEGAQHLEAILADLIDGQGNMAVVVELGEVDDVEPPRCMTVLTTAAAAIAARGGELRLTDTPLVLRDALRLAGPATAVTVGRRPLPTTGTQDRPGQHSARANHPAGRKRADHPQGGTPDDST